MTPNTTRVLVIDDHQLTRSLLRSLLREAGYTTQRECGEALSGIKLANHFRPHAATRETCTAGPLPAMR